MEKFLITMKSGNRITGPIMMTTSPRATCPEACPLRKTANTDEAGLCYAEHGHLGHYIWSGLDKALPGERISGRIPVYSLTDLLQTVRELPEETLWRHNQAGDLPSLDQRTINRPALRQLADANRGRRGFTYTHFDVLDDQQNREAIREANDAGFTINLSADSMDEADQLYDAQCGPVTVVLPSTQMENTTTPLGRRVIVCPARIHEDMTCATCGICAVPHRKAIVGFPALGPAKSKMH